MSCGRMQSRECKAEIQSRESKNLPENFQYNFSPIAAAGHDGTKMDGILFIHLETGVINSSPLYGPERIAS